MISGWRIELSFKLFPHSLNQSLPQLLEHCPTRKVLDRFHASWGMTIGANFKEGQFFNPVNNVFLWFIFYIKPSVLINYQTCISVQLMFNKVHGTYKFIKYEMPSSDKFRYFIIKCRRCFTIALHNIIIQNKLTKSTILNFVSTLLKIKTLHLFDVSLTKFYR